MAKVSLLRIGQVSRRVSEMTGQEVSNDWCSTKLKEIDPVDGCYYGKTKQFTGQQAALLAAFAVEWYHKHDAPKFTNWIREHGHTVPNPFVPVAVEKRPATRGPESPVSSTREIERIVKRAVEAALKERKVTAAIENKSRNLNREEDTKPLHRAVNRFVFEHPIDVRSCWSWLQKLWEDRNGMKVMRVGDQSFPQWLHSSNNMDCMMAQLQGFLDFMHDSIVDKQRSLNL